MPASTPPALRIKWLSSPPNAIRKIADWTAVRFGPLLPPDVEELVFEWTLVDPGELMPGQRSPLVFLKERRPRLEIAIMSEDEFVPEYLHSGVLRAMLEAVFDERPDAWWETLGRTVRNAPLDPVYVLPETGIGGLERIYQAAVRGQMARVLDMLTGELVMMNGSAEFVPLWNREHVPQGVRVAAMMEYDFDPLREAHFTDWMREKGLGDLADAWAAELQERSAMGASAAGGSEAGVDRDERTAKLRRRHRT